MAGLSAGLYDRCRIILLRCAQFDSREALRTVFVSTDLALYQNSIPEPANRDDRVTQLVSFLIQKQLRDGRPAFPLFLAALRDLQSPEDKLYEDLREILNEVERELEGSQNVSIPFVIVAMTSEEADNLETEKVFDRPDVTQVDRDSFKEFKTELEAHGIQNLLPHYKEARDKWEPYTCAPKAIDEIITEMVDHLNQFRDGTSANPFIEILFLSEEFFQENEDEGAQVWVQLSQSGGVLIVDAVSLFHPLLRQKLSKSAISSNEQVALLVLSPISSNQHQVNRLVEGVINSQMKLIFRRFDRTWDRLCEIGVGDLRALQRWLFSVLPEEASIIKQFNPAYRRVLREKMGEPLGIGQLIAGK
jgi:hypothetical protein